MLIIALGLAVIGLAALVFAVVTSNEFVAWACIVASVLGVVLLIIDALRERQRREAGAATKESGPAAGEDSHRGEGAADYPEEAFDEGDESDEGDEASAAADAGTDADAAGEYGRGDSVSDDHNAR